ncbi:MAG: hypothetical protein ACR2RA_23315 [Geminicoccaceae bacterium]
MIEISRVWLLPPLAFGRVGSADTPCQAYSWAPPTITPEGSAKTILVPEDTIDVAGDGTPTRRLANQFNRINLKDDAGRFFPVCPFFELHGAWTEDGTAHEGPITEDVLTGAGLVLNNVRWTVAVANLKPYHYTLEDSDRIQALVDDIGADDTTRRDLEGRTPTDTGGTHLVSGDDHVHFGAMQAVRPTGDLPGLRLRIYAPKGVVYAPTDILARISSDFDWRDLDVPPERRILNPAARWATYRMGFDAPGPIPGDGRLNPGGLAATFGNFGQSLGLVDDVSDGLVTCRVGSLPAAEARIAIGPPDFSPASRPFVSIQDGLSDRVARDFARTGDFGDGELEEIVADIFERALETSDLVNKDAQTGRCHNENGVTLPPPSEDFETPPISTLWARGGVPGDVTSNVDALPVSFKGQRKHHRLNALEYLKDRLRDDTAFVERWLRPPLDEFQFFDRRMPALMRGSDRRPLHLTRRQYDLVARWARDFIASHTS